MLLGCQSAQRDFDKAVAANTDQALVDFIGAHAGHPLATEAKRLLEKRAFESCREQASLRCHEEFLTRFAASPLRAEVEQRLAKLAGEKAYKWRPKRDSAGSSSRDIEVEETSKGLRNIWKDGTVEVDRAGVPADDEQKRSFVSRKATLDGKTVFVMAES
jgi:hypothetical protein